MCNNPVIEPIKQFSLKKIIILPILLLTAISSFCQVNFETLSFDAALLRSKQTGKLIFLQFESAGCGQCNEVADKAFENKKLSELLEQTFICIKITTDHPDRVKVSSLYNKKENSFGSMFINSDGTLLHNYSGSTTYIKAYEEHIDKALSIAGEGMKVSEMEREYKSGNKSPGLMELLMGTKKTLNLETDSLLDEYVSLLPPDSFSSIRTLQFIASMAPLLDSKADKKLRQNNSLFNQCWYPMSLPVRVGINNRIGYKSMQKAIREKNEKYAYRVAAFSRGTFSSNITGGERAFESKMMDYYQGINDTLAYFIRSINYYDNYFMSVSVDSVKRRDSITMKMIFAKPSSPKPVQNGAFQQIVKYSPIVQYFNRELNRAALAFYEMTDDPLYLARAIKWSARANEFFEHYISLNTHALLLYATGKKEDALVWQDKAIQDKKKRGYDTKNLERELSDMKKGKIKQGK
ncbi:MAG TPA: DUF255 domain-containing protein [Chitinophagaceae bacterium]|nr:DUF255 domain-containing protein [Chitinophagaceae bacterium]